jgi:hypothetical protein
MNHTCIRGICMSITFDPPANCNGYWNETVPPACVLYIYTCVLWLTESVVPYCYALATTEVVLVYSPQKTSTGLPVLEHGRSCSCLTDRAEDFSEARRQRVEWPDRDPVESSHRPRAHHLTAWPVAFFAPLITVILHCSALTRNLPHLDCPYPRTVVLLQIYYTSRR